MFEIFIIMLSGSWYPMWQIIVFFILLFSYPDDDGKSDGNMLVINNMWWNIFYTHAFVDFITLVKVVGDYSTDGSTATFVAGVSTNAWHRIRILGIGGLVQWITYRWQKSWPSHISEFLILVIHDLRPWGKVWCFRIARDVCFGRFKFAFGRNKKGRVFGILSRFKKTE